MKCLSAHHMRSALCSCFCAASMITLAASAAIAGDPNTAPGAVITTLNTPCSYPVGLASDGTSLFVLDWRTCRIHKVSVAGERQAEYAVPSGRPHGLAWGAGKLYVSDEHTGAIHVLNGADGKVERTLAGPGRRITGLAWLNKVLYALDAGANRIVALNPTTGAVLRRFLAPSFSSTSLGADGRYLWVSDRKNDELYMVAAETGNVIDILKAPGPYPEGIAALGGDLWTTDFQDRRLYRLAVKDTQPYRLSDSREARIEYLWGLSNHGPGDVRDLSVCIAVPTNLPGQKLLSDVEWKIKPARLTTDRWGQSCAIFDDLHISSGQKHLLSYSVNARISTVRYFILPEKCGTLADIPADIRAAYTGDGQQFRLLTPYMRQTAQRIVGNEQNPYWVARKIYQFLLDQLEYDLDGAWDPPDAVLQRGLGSCSEYTFAFIALCRSVGLPARYQGSIAVRGDEAGVDESFHRWAEVYLPNYGWIPVDANKGDAIEPADQARGFGELAGHYLITTAGGGESECLAWGYNSFAKFRATGACQTEEETLGIWEPLRTANAATATVPPTTVQPERQ